VAGSPINLEVSGGADAIFPYIVPPNTNPIGVDKVSLFPAEDFTLTGMLAPGDVITYTIQGGTNFNPQTGPLPDYSGIINTAGSINMSFRYVTPTPAVFLEENGPYIINEESGMGFTISITHINPTMATSIQLLDPITVGETTLAPPVPEPATLALLGIDTVALIGYGRRRRKLAAA
jgi:hypothetical protein